MRSTYRRGTSDERGFSLIELMVVVLIIAILMAIAIPTFIAARKRSQDRMVQKNLRSVFVTELTYYADAQVYTDNSGGELTAIEPGLTYGTGMIPDTTKSGWVGLDGGRVYLSTQSRSGMCFYIREDATAGTTYAKDPDCQSALVQVYSTTAW